MSRMRASKGGGLGVCAAARVSAAAFAIALAISLLVAPSWARANACTAGSAPLKTDSGLDPCAEYKLNKTAAIRQKVSGGIHAAASVLCAIECLPSYAKAARNCKIGTYIAIGADAIGAIAIRSKGEELGGVLMGSLTTAFGAVMVGEMFGGDEVKADKPELKKNEDTKTEVAKTDEKKKWNKGACIRAGLEALQSGNQWYQASKSQDRAKVALDKKVELAAPDLPKLVAGGGGDGSSSSATATPSEVKTDSVSSEPVVTAQDIKESAAQAEFRPLFDAFKAETGQPVDGIFDAMANGVSPVTAAVAIAGGALGEAGAVFSKIGELGEEEARKQDQDASLAGGVQGFERAGGGGGGAKHDSDDDGMGDLNAMLANLMPGKGGKEAAAPGAKGIQFGRAPSAVSSDGFHPASRSIFEIVDARYQAVAGRFLAGDVAPSARQPAGAVPKNVYLRK